MKVFVDSNVFIAAVTDEPGRGSTATALLNREYEFHTSVLNLMEIRSVLSKKKRREQHRIERVERQILTHTDLVIPGTSDVLAADSLQEETLLYPMDCLVKACADSEGAVLTTFDAELIHSGATSPSTLLGRRTGG